MIPLSVLDLVPVREGGTVAEALAATTAAAQVAEAAGYKRFWVAEHHDMPGIAGGAASVVLAHIGDATSTIRIGSGGIMLPNHNPYVIAEQFGTLDALFPGRVDLGLGRAPGASGRIAAALRKDLNASAQNFPRDVVELRALFTGEPAIGITANPGLGAAVEMWILGSSLFGAQLAAMLGMPFAFASHFAPDHLDEALAIYRRDFTPSETLERPHVMAAMTVFTATTDEEAILLASTQEQSFVALRTGTPGKMQPPVTGYREMLPPHMRAGFETMRQVSAIGSPATVRAAISAFVERAGADEIVVSGATYEPEARRESLRLTMDAVS